MCELAFSFDKRIKVSDLEIKRGGKSYTYLTLEELSAPNTELFFLVGTDMTVSLDCWDNPERIFELAKIVYVRRENDPIFSALIEKKTREYREKFGAEIIGIDNEVVEISSEQIRAAMKAKAPLDGYLSEEVSSYIEKEGLYK